NNCDRRSFTTQGLQTGVLSSHYLILKIMRLIVGRRIFQSIPFLLHLKESRLEVTLAMDKTRRLGHANFM
ncbi:hypothetical protein R0J91_18885, partial [Micrococcus sp. SIMBA_131]